MNKVLLVLLVMLSLSMVYAATAKGKTATDEEDTLDRGILHRRSPPNTCLEYLIEEVCDNVIALEQAEERHGKTAAKDVAKKHSDKMIPDIVKKLEAIEKEKSPTERRKQILALIRKNPKAFVAAVSIYFRKYRIPVRRLPIPV